jgi:hypothetical protein
MASGASRCPPIPRVPVAGAEPVAGAVGFGVAGAAPARAGEARRAIVVVMA